MRARGFTLVEMLVALTLGSLIVAALYGVDRQYRRFSLWQKGVTEAHDAYRVALSILSPELREAVPADGDLALPSPDSLIVRTPVGFAIVCASRVNPPSIALAWSTGRMPETSADSLLLYTGSGWTSLSATKEPGRGRGALECPYPGHTTPDDTYRLPPGTADTVPVGAPVRVYLREIFHAVMDGDELWLARTDATGTQLLAGPMTAGGIRFRLLDADGAATGRMADVRAIELRLIFPTIPDATGSDAGRDTLTTLFQGRNG